MPSSIDVFAKVRGHEREELLRAAREADVLPYFHVLSSPAMPVVEMEGAERIMLGPNNYLGLTGDERVLAGAGDALHGYGTGLTGSRLLNGTIPLHLELEQEIAEWMGTEAALVFSTGHQANLGTLGTLLAPGDTVIVDSADHASILDGCLLSRAKLRAFRHNRLEKLEKMLERAQGVGAALSALRVVRSEEGPPLLEAVLARAERLRDGLEARGFAVVAAQRIAAEPGVQLHAPGVRSRGEEHTIVTPIVPVLVGDDWKAAVLWKALYDAGVFVNTALHPAVPPGGALLRTSVMATHDDATIDRALDVFAAVKEDFEAEHGPLPGPGTH